MKQKKQKTVSKSVRKVGKTVRSKTRKIAFLTLAKLVFMAAAQHRGHLSSIGMNWKQIKGRQVVLIHQAEIRVYRNGGVR